MNALEHDALALKFIGLEQSLRGLPAMKEVFEMAKDVIKAAPHTQDSSGAIIITTPLGRDTTLHASAIDRALHAVGVTDYSSRLSNSDVLKDIMNQASEDKNSLEGLLRQPTYDQVEFVVPNPSLLRVIAPQ